MVINTNIAATAATRNLAASTDRLSQSLARLSSGSKITSPEDDAAGLAQVIRFEAQMNRNSAVRANLGNATSFSQTQDGFLQKVQVALDRMSELSVLSQDVTKTNTDRSNYSVEFTQLQNYISDIGTKSFNGVTLFRSSGEAVTIDSDAAKFTMNAVDMTSTTATTGLARIYNSSTSAITTTTSAARALSNIQTSIQNSGGHASQGGCKHSAFEPDRSGREHPERKPVGCEQPNQGRGCSKREHGICPRKHPCPERHCDVDAGKRFAAVGSSIDRLRIGAKATSRKGDEARSSCSKGQHLRCCPFGFMKE